MQRLFLGISTHQEQSKQLVFIQNKLKRVEPIGVGKPVKSSNFHMTLAFLGQVNEESFTFLINALDNIHNTSGWPKFQVKLNSLILWRKPQVLCLAASAEMKCDPQLLLTVEHCQQISYSLASLSFPGKRAVTKPDFTPHITLFRKAKKDPQQAFQKIESPSIFLRPDQLHLYQSINGVDGVEYHILRSWPMQ
ncbi:RNA 2',3'-cyclic phosphodiesterase [Shewanella eurypsychrophilus]|uniref:RNA 2',3'-cyclic phosphodiesterase n=1 Tax=Shewanella eurypsychrophilus TaxID=2593656 RepID=A0ABX6V4E9_9GAMM|nr:MULTISPECIES: RNA 2',3'-cyclic phosphodiesterase [Shewanella]QFU21375.1 RNA 2',3'-cyclic phosphodiesterase [Shewanella sp. YLB-09]QPG56665.1 RNA 2',3'-cyclic phosphodiesterase [Shewanella eurypsychrophilus]